MKFKQNVFLKHPHGITAQWISEDYSTLAIATYQQNEIKATNTSGEEVVVKKWALTNCSGPWTGVSEDGKSLVIIPGYEKELAEISSQANIILTCIGAYIGGKKAFTNMWQATILGIENDFWPEDRPL